jgi:hypothetical protein
MSSSDSSVVFPKVKVNTSSVSFGEPSQLLRQLESGDCQAVLQVRKTTGGLTVGNPLLSWPSHFAGNLRVLFCLPRIVDLVLETSPEGKQIVTLALTDDEFSEDLRSCLAFWEEKLIQQVNLMYPSKTPQIMGPITRNRLEMKIDVYQNKAINMAEFFEECTAKKRLPYLGFDFVWIGSTVNDNSKTHGCGFKFLIKTFAAETEKSVDSSKKRVRAAVSDVPVIEDSKGEEVKEA